MVGDGNGDGARTEIGTETRERTQKTNGDGSGNGIRDGEGKEKGVERGEEDSSGIRHIRKKNRVEEDQALLFHTRYHLCRQEVVPADSQELRA